MNQVQKEIRLLQNQQAEIEKVLVRMKEASKVEAYAKATREIEERMNDISSRLLTQISYQKYQNSNAAAAYYPITECLKDLRKALMPRGDS